LEEGIGVLCDRRIPVELYKSVVPSALTYGLEAAPLKRNEGLMWQK
jgi:hypothetical protein